MENPGDAGSGEPPPPEPADTPDIPLAPRPPLGPHPPEPASAALPPGSWPALVVAMWVIPAAGIVAGVVLVAAAALGGEGLGVLKNQERLTEWMGELISTPVGFAVVIAPSMLVFLVAALVPAMLSPRPVHERLGFVRGRVPIWSYPVLMVGTLAVGLLSMLLGELLWDEPSEQVEFLTDLFTKPTGAFAVVVVLTLSVVPGFVEESLFRGYVQTRLLARWHPVMAIGFTSLFFAAAHVDLQHFVGVLPLGIWLGVVAWRAASIWPAVCCHFFTNFVFVLMARLRPESVDQDDFTWTAITTADLVWAAVVVMAFGASIWVLVRYGRNARGHEVGPLH